MWSAPPRRVVVFRCNVELRTLLFCFRWESFQPVLFGQPSSSQNNSYRSERGTEQRAESVPSVPNTSSRFRRSCSPTQRAYLVSRPPEPPSFGVEARGVLLLLTLVPSDFIMRCSVCQGLLWVTSPISDFLLCVIRLSQTLSTATDKSEGVGTQEGGDKRPS